MSQSMKIILTLLILSSSSLTWNVIPDYYNIMMGIIGQCRSPHGNTSAKCVINYNFAKKDKSGKYFCGVQNNKTFCPTVENQYCNELGQCVPPPNADIKKVRR